VRAALQFRYGPPEVVELRDVDVPTPADEEVLVRVRAASVNRADLDKLYARWSFLRLFLGVRAPREQRLGADVAGTVEVVGPGVSEFKPGDEVYGDLFSSGGGSFAEYALAPQGALAIKPPTLSFEDAATLPHSAILALQGLRRRNGQTFEPGARVLIVGASGSVGPFAIQIAKARGAHVTGVASAAKLEFVRSIGADEVIDYATTDYTHPAQRYDWIVDVNAHHSVLDWRHALRPGGVYSAMGADSAAWFAKTLVQGPALSLASRRSMGLMLHWKPFHEPDVKAIEEMLARGQLRPRIDRTFKLDDVVAALRYFDEGHARGKVLLLPDGVG
jgi:NADPH:quinone reductase-like Zn-dependent oxidoreductase